MLHAIQEGDSDEPSFGLGGGGMGADPISSGGSLSEFKSDGDEDGQGDQSDHRQRDSPEKEVMRRVSQTADEGGAAGLLALVKSERTRMSAAVIGSSDKLSSAVLSARKKLQGSIAAVEAAVQCEKMERDRARGEVGAEADPFAGVPPEERSASAKLRATVIDQDARIQTLDADLAASQFELEEAKLEAHNMRHKLEQERVKACALMDDNAALKAEVASLRERLSEQAYLLPTETADKNRLSLPPSSPLPRAPALAHPYTRFDNTSAPPRSRGASPMKQRVEWAGGEVVSGADPSPFSGVQRIEGLGKVVLEGVLRKKKTEHGIFEDAWKQRLQCSLHASALVCEAIVDGKLSGVKDVFPLTEWHVPQDRRVPGSAKTPSKADGQRFDLITKSETKEPGWMSVSVVSLRADSPSDCDRWVNAITSTRSFHLAATPPLGFPAGPSVPASN